MWSWLPTAYCGYLGKYFEQALLGNWTAFGSMHCRLKVSFGGLKKNVFFFKNKIFASRCSKESMTDD